MGGPAPSIGSSSRAGEAPSLPESHSAVASTGTGCEYGASSVTTSANEGTPSSVCVAVTAANATGSSTCSHIG